MRVSTFLFAAVLVVPLLVAWGAAVDATPHEAAFGAPFPLRDRSLQEPPEFRTGDWWDFDHKDLASGAIVVGKIVVTSVTAEGYELGLEGIQNLAEPMLARPLPLGAVDRLTLSTAIDGKQFRALEFPLEQGRFWRTHHGATPVLATVEHANGLEASLVYRWESQDPLVVRGTYDAALGMFSTLAVDGLYELRIHRHGHGLVDVMANVPARFTSVNFAGLERHGGIAAPTVTTHVPHGLDQLALSVQVGCHTENPSNGFQIGSAYGALLYTPTDEMYTITRSDYLETPQTVYVVHNDPGGTWRLTGSGVFAEGLAYDLTRSDIQAVPMSAAIFAVPTAPATVADENEAAVLMTTIAVAMIAWKVWSMRRFGRWPFLLPFFARLDREEVLEHPVRRQIYELVRADPGVHTDEIRARLGLASGAASHHLGVLARHKFLESEKWGHIRTWFVVENAPRSSRSAASALHRHAAKRVYQAIVDSPGIHISELGRRLGLHHTTIMFHVRRLEQAKLVVGIPSGRRRGFTSAAAVAVDCPRSW